MILSGSLVSNETGRVTSKSVDFNTDDLEYIFLVVNLTDDGYACDLFKYSDRSYVQTVYFDSECNGDDIEKHLCFSGPMFKNA